MINMMDEVSRTFAVCGRYIQAVLALIAGTALRLALALSYLFWVVPYRIWRRR